MPASTLDERWIARQTAVNYYMSNKAKFWSPHSFVKTSSRQPNVLSIFSVGFPEYAETKNWDWEIW